MIMKKLFITLLIVGVTSFAGDRWTGNAYVDLAEGRRPIIDLMDGLGFSVATLGNHEFDKGARFLANAIGYAKFETVCANVISEDGELPAQSGLDIFRKVDAAVRRRQP